MAYSPVLFSFFFLVALVCSPPLAAVNAAREGQQYFAKASPTTASTFPRDGDDEQVDDWTPVRTKAQTFAADNQLYSSNNDNSYYPTNTREAATDNYNPTATTNKPTRSKATTNPIVGTNDLYSRTADEVAHYYSIDSLSNAPNRINNLNSKAVAATGQENNNVHYYDGYRFGTGNKKSGSERQTQQMGMSDTRFLGNGKYFYNINQDKAIYSVNAGSTKAVYNQQQTYDPTTTIQGRSRGKPNSKALAQDDDYDYKG